MRLRPHTTKADPYCARRATGRAVSTGRGRARAPRGRLPPLAAAGRAADDESAGGVGPADARGRAPVARGGGEARAAKRPRAAAPAHAPAAAEAAAEAAAQVMIATLHGRPAPAAGAAEPGRARPRSTPSRAPRGVARAGAAAAAACGPTATGGSSEKTDRTSAAAAAARDTRSARGEVIVWS